MTEAYVNHLKGNSIPEKEEGEVREKTLGRAGVRVFEKSSAFRPVVLAANNWVLYWPTPVKRRVDAIHKTTGTEQDTLHSRDIDVTIQFLKRMSRGEMKILMTFPRDWKFSCDMKCGGPLVTKCTGTDEMCVDTRKLKDCCEEKPEEDDTQYIAKPTDDSRCFGDAIPPLIAMRAGLDVMMKNKSYTGMKYVVDIFCSCGGTSAGLAMTKRFDNLVSIDMDPEKLKIYASNFPGATILLKELRLPESESVEKNNFPESLVQDYENIIEIIVETAISRASEDRKQELRSTWRSSKDYERLRLPEIHLHGSPSCRDFSAASRGHVGGSSVTTIVWFAGFFVPPWLQSVHVHVHGGGLEREKLAAIKVEGYIQQSRRHHGNEGKNEYVQPR